MRDSMRLVCVTPAGRRRYLRLLVPYVLACPEIDRYDLWVNTSDPADLAFLQELAGIDPRLRLLTLFPPAEAGTAKLRYFWPEAADPDTVYVRLDDDVVWLDPAFFDTLLRARFALPDAFMVAPLVINQGLSSFVLQSYGRIVASQRFGPGRFDRVGWRNPSTAVSLHRLLQDLIAADEVGRLACGRLPVATNAFSINSLCWFGRDIAAFGGAIPPDEDEELTTSCTHPLRSGQLNWLETSAVAAHFAFYTQRLEVDASGLLEGYLRIAAARPELEPWRQPVEAAHARVEARFPGHRSPGGGFEPLQRPRRKLFSLRRRQHERQSMAKVSVARGPTF